MRTISAARCTFYSSLRLATFSLGLRHYSNGFRWYVLYIDVKGLHRIKPLPDYLSVDQSGLEIKPECDII